jgi:biotin carboxylase
MALAEAGCTVEMVGPTGHPASATRAVARTHRYRGVAPVRSVTAAIKSTRADLVIPCDDHATAHLHDLHRAAGAGEELRALIERSIGDASSFAVAASRTRLVETARELGVRVAETAVIRSADDLAAWIRQHGVPTVLKADGTYGGRGVRVVHSLDEAKYVFRSLRSPPSAARAIKRALINGDLSYMRSLLSGARPVVNAQRFVAGRDATSSIACRDGKVLAAITGIVVYTVGRLGPSSVVQIIENREMADAASRIVGRLRLSGMVGFDFVIEQRSGDAYLIEMNPRATQMGHLPLGEGRDLAAALRAAVCGESVRRTSSVTDKDVIALFPQEMQRDPKSPLLNEAYHDVPWEEPDLIEACLHEPMAVKVWTGAMSTASLTRKGWHHIVGQFFRILR